MSKKIYAFVVGINDYPDPKDRLNGAVPDTGKIVQYLTDTFPKEQLAIKTLLNGEATYQNFIDGFRAHLGQATKNDVVWFHYSGHGSRQATATELQPYTSGNMDETLVLVDSRPDGRDLADKELGVLISEVEKSGAHMLVTLDCCHSGSGTRELEDPAVQYKSRMAAERGAARPLEKYLDGYFSKNGLNFPDTKHILLAACNRFQTAKETYTSSGVFTQNLVDTLKKTGNNISYADLFVRLRQGVITNRIPDQDPQLELMGGTNGYVRFLDGTPAGGMKKFPVYQEAGNWVMGAGAIQGLQDAAEQKIVVDLFTDESKDAFATATVTSVSFQRSVLSSTAALDAKGRYWAVPRSFPTPPEKVYFDGVTDGMAEFSKEIKGYPQMEVAAENEKNIAWLVLKQTTQGYELWESQQLIATASKTDDAAAQKLLILADQTISWKRMSGLQNPKTQLRAADSIVTVEVTMPGGKVTSYDPGPIKLDNNGNVYPCRLMVRNRMQQPLNYCLLYLSANYGVTMMKNEPIEPSDTPVVFWGGGSGDNFFLDKGMTSSNDTLLMIISTERVDDFELTMPDIALGGSVSETSDRGIAGINKYMPIKGEWFTNKFNVQIG